MKKVTKILWAILILTQGSFVIHFGIQMLKDSPTLLIVWIAFNVWLWCIAIPVLAKKGELEQSNIQNVDQTTLSLLLFNPPFFKCSLTSEQICLNMGERHG